jgi:hypothetical protein
MISSLMTDYRKMGKRSDHQDHWFFMASILEKFAFYLKNLLVCSDKPGNSYDLSRFIFLRSLGFIYAIAFLGIALQGPVLFGENGLLPATRFLKRVSGSDHFTSHFSWDQFTHLPTIFWFGSKDIWTTSAAWVGVSLSVLLLFGFTNAVLMTMLWFLYMSFVHIGQDFYSFGWDILLLETGFLAIFLCPLLDPRPFPGSPAPRIVFWLLRWLLFRLYLGAGLIKIRSDPCWIDLTCLIHHYETQPLPNPLSWLLHQGPPWFHKIGVLWNHVTELIVPFFLFGRRRLRLVGASLLMVFQLMLIFSGNLSFLNWLTLVITLGSFDDRCYKSFFQKLNKILLSKNRPWIIASRVKNPGLVQAVILWFLTAIVLVKSWEPTRNLFQSRQIMNGSFDPLHLVNTYGAFGAVGVTRPEIILEGTSDPVITELTYWKPYEFRYKPGDLRRIPPLVAPYQPRIDWQIWFAAMSTYDQHPWLVHLVYQLLKGNNDLIDLLAKDPFVHEPQNERVRFIRARLYRYKFTHIGSDTDSWWTREFIAEYLPPLSLSNPSLGQFLKAYDLKD